MVDAEQLREQIKQKYREVATDPGGVFHFRTGRDLADHLGYDPDVVAALPDQAVESLAGVASPFAADRLEVGARVVDIGSGAGFDSLIAAEQVGPTG